jgi:hypothetical protein
MRSLPILDDIHIATPCNADWDAMVPLDDERSRFCKKCNKSVYNLSAMSQTEAEKLVGEREGRMCVRFHRRAPVLASLALLVGLAGNASADVSIKDGKDGKPPKTKAQPKPPKKIDFDTNDIIMGEMPERLPEEPKPKK